MLPIILVCCLVYRHPLLKKKVRHHEDPDTVDQPKLYPDEEWPLIRLSLAVDVKGRYRGDDAHDDCEHDVDPK